MTAKQLIHPVFRRDLLLSSAGIVFEPSPGKLLVAKLPEDRLGQEGRLFVPPSAGRRRSMRTTWGQVMAVGKGVEFQLHDYVHFGEFSGYGPPREDGLQRHDAHLDISSDGEFRALPGVPAKKRRFVVLSWDEIDLYLRLDEDGELLPVLHDS